MPTSRTRFRAPCGRSTTPRGRAARRARACSSSSLRTTTSCRRSPRRRGRSRSAIRDHASLRGDRETRLARARRQEPQYRLRGCRPRGRDSELRVVDLLLRGAELRGALARARRAVCVRRLRVDVRRAGAVAQGRRSEIMRLCAETVKRVSLELGGKSPNIVFADADLADAIPSSVWSIYYSAGQSCEARSRVLVEQSAYDDFVSTFAAQARSLKVGDPRSCVSARRP